MSPRRPSTAPTPPPPNPSPLSYAGIGGLSEVLGWTEVQQEKAGGFLGGSQARAGGVVVAGGYVWDGTCVGRHGRAGPWGRGTRAGPSGRTALAGGCVRERGRPPA